MVVLDEAGVGDGGGQPFTFDFTSSAPAFKGTLLQFAGYEALGVAITDDNGVVLAPLITFNPARNILFDFKGTTGNYTAHVSAIGEGGVFGIQIQAVPIPAAMVLFASALALFGVIGRSKKASAAAA